MGKKSRTKHPKKTSAVRGLTEDVYVAHPTIPGVTEKVRRVINSLDTMLNSNLFGKEPFAAKRRYEAAKIFRNAWDTVNSSIGQAMDLDRVRSNRYEGYVPIANLEAAAKLREAHRVLYAMDYDIIALVLGAGYGIGETAKCIHRELVTRKQAEEIGSRMRCALDELAGHWLIQENRESTMRAWRPTESVPRGSETSQVTPARVAHANRKAVVIS